MFENRFTQFWFAYVFKSLFHYSFLAITPLNIVQIYWNSHTLFAVINYVIKVSKNFGHFWTECRT